MKGWGRFTEWLFDWDYLVIQKWQFMVSVLRGSMWEIVLDMEWRLGLVE
jgi:hypothetical protein